MFELENVKYVLKKLWARKSRSFLTILSIFIGITTIFVFISFGLGLYNYVDDLAETSGVDKFIVQPSGVGAPGIDTTFALKDKDVNIIEKTQGVKRTASFYLKAVEVEKDGIKKYVFLMGHGTTNSELQLLSDIMTVKIYQGRNLKKGDLNKVVLGYNYQLDNSVFKKALKTNDKIMINGKKFEIVGFYDQIGNPSDDSNIYMIQDAMKLFFAGKELSYGMIVGQVENKDDISKVVESVKKNLRNSRNQEIGKEDFFVQTYEELIAQFSIILNIIIGFIILIALISVVVSAINTANTMVTSVIERIPEIGIMKSIGATNAAIRNLFLLESSILGLVGGLIGVLLGYIISSTLGNILNTLGWGFLSPQYTPTLFLGLIIFSISVGTLSGVFVAVKAARQNPVDALRYE